MESRVQRFVTRAEKARFTAKEDLMKRIISLLLSVLLLAACVPTPESDAVRQKDTNVLIDTVLTEESERGDAAPAPVKALFPERFQCDFTTEARHVHVTADVPIRVHTSGGFPLLRVEHRTLTDAERLTVYRRLFGKDELYIFSQRQRTREDVAQYIQQCLDAIEYLSNNKAEWMRETDSTEDEWQELLASHKKRVEELKQEYNALPEDSVPQPNAPWDGSLPEPNPDIRSWNHYEIVGDAYEQDSIWRYDNASAEEQTKDDNITFYAAIPADEFGRGSTGFSLTAPGARRLDRSEYDLNLNGAKLTAREAAALVQSMVADVAPQYEIADIYWSNNAFSDGDTAGQYLREGYFVLLTQRFADAQTVFCSALMGSFAEDKFWPYDSITASVDSEGRLMSLDWSGALKVTGTVSETTTLLPFDEIFDVVTRQMNYNWGDERHDHGTVVIDDVQLGLMRIREKNQMENGLLVPVWFFTGVFTYSDAQRDARIKEGHFPAEAARDVRDSSRPLLIVNAIDGSVIDPQNGY